MENCEKYNKKPNEENKNLVKISLNKAYSLIDKAVKKNVLHKNTGANKKSKINNYEQCSTHRFSLSFNIRQF